MSRRQHAHVVVHACRGVGERLGSVAEEQLHGDGVVGVRNFGVHVEVGAGVRGGTARVHVLSAVREGSVEIRVARSPVQPRTAVTAVTAFAGECASASASAPSVTVESVGTVHPGTTGASSTVSTRTSGRRGIGGSATATGTEERGDVSEVVLGSAPASRGHTGRSIHCGQSTLPSGSRALCDGGGRERTTQRRRRVRWIPGGARGVAGTATPVVATQGNGGVVQRTASGGGGLVVTSRSTADRREISRAGDGGVLAGRGRGRALTSDAARTNRDGDGRRVVRVVRGERRRGNLATSTATTGEEGAGTATTATTDGRDVVVVVRRRGLHHVRAGRGELHTSVTGVGVERQGGRRRSGSIGVHGSNSNLVVAVSERREIRRRCRAHTIIERIPELPTVGPVVHREFDDVVGDRTIDAGGRCGPRHRRAVDRRSGGCVGSGGLALHCQQTVDVAEHVTSRHGTGTVGGHRGPIGVGAVGIEAGRAGWCRRERDSPG